MSNTIQIDNIGCLYTANKDGVQSYNNTTLTIKNGLIKEKLKGLDFQEIHIIDQNDCKKKEVEDWGQS